MHERTYHLLHHPRDHALTEIALEYVLILNHVAISTAEPLDSEESEVLGDGDSYGLLASELDDLLVL
jgi:hypothetical protein